MASRVEKTIGEYNFFIRKLPALEALKLVGDLQKRIIGPASALIATQRNEALSDEGFAEGIRKLSEALDGDTLLWAFKKLANPEYVSFQPSGEEVEKLTENVIGKYELPLDVLIELAIEVAKVNYMDFGKSATGLFSLVRAQTKNPQ